MVYELSAEHHLFGEITLDRVENWEFHGPQTEEEVSTSAEALALAITDSKQITIANYRAYRVTRSYAPFPAAIRVYGSSGIRLRNVSVNAEHGYSACDDAGCGTKLRAGKFAYDNALEDVTNRREVRERLFAVLDLGPALPAATAAMRRSAGAGAASRQPSRSSRAASTRSRARRWTPPARCTSSITTSSGSSRGRRPPA